MVRVLADRFTSLSHAQQMFGEVAGRYFYEAFDDGRLHGDLGVFANIAEQWGSVNTGRNGMR